MKGLQRFLSTLAGIAMLIILLISSFEIGAYSDYGWYQKEYEKYNVLVDLEMEMPEVMRVTKEMMSYLRGNRADLVVDTIVDGEEREFFNDREKAHMIDVKNLFVGGLWLRRGAMLVLVFSFFVLIKTKADWKRLLPKSFLISMSSFIGVTLVAGFILMTDFNRYFTLFHEIFFTNDLWLLDPYTDLLIRMLPEGFFLDMVIRIGIIFLILMISLLVISVLSLKRSNIRKTNKSI